MEQKYTSKDTSINKVNYIFKHYPFPKDSVVLDWGSGKYDACKNATEALGARYLPYDPYNIDEETNKASLDYAENYGVSYIVCANVLNVIKEDEIIKETVKKIASLCQPNTQVIVSVYIGDKSEKGCATTKGWQRNENLYSYYKFFDPYFNVIYWKNCFICTLKNKKKG